MKLFPPALLAIFALLFITGYAAGFIVGSVAIEKSIIGTVLFLRDGR